MAHKTVNQLFMKKEYYQFQVACVSYLNLKQNKPFKEQVDKFLSNQFDVTTSQQMRKTLKQDNNCFIDLIMFYENRKSLIFDVLVVVVYCFIDK